MREKQNQKKIELQDYNYGVAVLRVTAMFFILICHIIRYYDFIPKSENLGQFFNIGVQIFFVISGILYGNRDIANCKLWIWHRWIKICIPVIVWDIILVVFRMGGGKKISSFLIYLFNIQGLPWISDCFYFDQIQGLAHTWFITIIMLCYLLIPVLQYIKKNFSVKKIKWGIIFLWIIAVIFPFVRIQGLFYFALFITGYFIRAFSFEDYFIKKKQKFIILGSVLFIVSMIARLVFRRYYDNTVLYNNVIVSITMSYMALYFIMLVLIIAKCFHTSIGRLCANKAFRGLEKYSLFIYIVHYEFLDFGIYEKYSLFISTILFIIWSIVMAYILKLLSELPLKLKKY